nr:hypothetical protein [Mesorhizobium sp.]
MAVANINAFQLLDNETRSAHLALDWRTLARLGVNLKQFRLLSPGQVFDGICFSMPQLREHPFDPGRETLLSTDIGIIVVATIWQSGICHTGKRNKRVVASTTNQQVLAGTAEHRIVTGASRDEVVCVRPSYLVSAVSRDKDRTAMRIRDWIAILIRELHVGKPNALRTFIKTEMHGIETISIVRGLPLGCMSGSPQPFHKKLHFFRVGLRSFRLIGTEEIVENSLQTEHLAGIFRI